MSKILITGGIGLIGNEVVGQLLKKGHKINVLDIHDINIEGVNYFKGSILDKNIISKAMDGCDYVVHLAAVLGVANSTKKPLECLDVNIQGTKNILECCVAKKIKKIVFSSSSEVYGEPLIIPIKEDSILQPKSEYGVSKVVGEEYIKAYNVEYGLNYGIVRFFNVYGPIQTDNFVLPIFVKNVVLDKPLKVFGDGSQVRAFCYVGDAARGLIEVLLNEKADKQVLNIGNVSTQISMLELARLILKVAGKDEEPVLVPFEKSDRKKEREIFTRIPDVSKAKEILGFEAKIGLEEGIKKVLDYKRLHKEEI